MSNNYYIDCKEFKIPFVAEDFLLQEDIDLVNAYEFPQEVKVRFPNSKITWNNWQIGTNKMGEHVNQSDKERFNGLATITDTKLKHRVREWLYDTFNENFFDNKFTSHGRASPPITILCFNKTSAWHREGPVKVPHGFHINPEPMQAQRWPAVMNFRLTGDIEDSIIQFAEISDTLQEKYDQLRNKFFNTWRSKALNDGTKFENTDIDTYTDYDKSAEKRLIHHEKGRIFWTGGHTLTDAEYLDKLRMMLHTDYILDENLYKDHITKMSQHVGMHNPYIVNLSKWHRVITNGTPRVTFRLHVNRKLGWDDIREMYETGKLFK